MAGILCCFKSCFKNSSLSPSIQSLQEASQQPVPSPTEPAETEQSTQQTQKTSKSSKPTKSTSEQVKQRKKIKFIACAIFKSALAGAASGAIAGAVLGSPAPGIGNLVFGVLSGVGCFTGGLLYYSIQYYRNNNCHSGSVSL